MFQSVHFPKTCQGELFMVLKLTRPCGGQGPNPETCWFQQIGGASLLDIHTIEDGLIICRVASDFFDLSRIWGMWRTIGLDSQFQSCRWCCYSCCCFCCSQEWHGMFWKWYCCGCCLLWQLIFKTVVCDCGCIFVSMRC